MKTVATLVAFATFIAAPAFAQAPPKQSDVVSFGGKYLGQDPDPAVRAQIKRDSAVHSSGE